MNKYKTKYLAEKMEKINKKHLITFLKNYDLLPKKLEID